jgi:predicted GNAT family N-acyltransferase
LHAVLRNRMGLVVATGRLLPAVQGVSKIGRMAVKRAMRGMRLGDQILSALMEAAQKRGDTCVRLHAQCSAEHFYQRQGFVRQGEVFQEANMDHVIMEKTL